MSETKKSIWQTLSKIDCSNYIEKKNGLTYLSWAWAWGITKEHYPDATYTIREWENGTPYFFNENLGYLVQTSVTIQDETLSMRLPVMDGANKAQKHIKYTYSVQKKEWSKAYNRYVVAKDTSGNIIYDEKPVEPATMFDINTAYMRCLAKNIALFGLGHYIYAGEDIPMEYTDAEKAVSNNVEKQKEKGNVVSTPNISKAPAELLNTITAALGDIDTIEKLAEFSKTPDAKKALNYPELKLLFKAKKDKIKK